MTARNLTSIAYQHTLLFIDPIGGLVSNDDVYLTLSLHEVFCVDHKM